MLLKPELEIFPNLRKAIEEFELTFPKIPLDRRKELDDLSQKLVSSNLLRLNFICTHNSRRSHLAQIWAATAAAYFGLTDLVAFSGGTESTAFNPRAVAALERVGFEIHKPPGENPRYLVRFSDEAEPLICFSKRFDHATNPDQHFAAIMTCSDADEHCPFIPGATLRFPLTYRDPKEADDTPQEARRYDERTEQIGREMCYLLASLAV